MQRIDIGSGHIIVDGDWYKMNTKTLNKYLSDLCSTVRKDQYFATSEEVRQKIIRVHQIFQEPHPEKKLDEIDNLMMDLNNCPRSSKNRLGITMEVLETLKN